MLKADIHYCLFRKHIVMSLSLRIHMTMPAIKPVMCAPQAVRQHIPTQQLLQKQHCQRAEA